MMDTQVDRELLEKIADLVGKPVGAFIAKTITMPYTLIGVSLCLI